jgi:hypothetical protein
MDTKSNKTMSPKDLKKKEGLLHMLVRTTAVLMLVLPMVEIRHCPHFWNIKLQYFYREICIQIQPELNLEPSPSERVN